MRVGVTGRYASGKGTVCEMFADFGAVHIDTDSIAAEVTAPGGVCLTPIRDFFGDDVFNSDGSLNRRRLAEIVFNDERQLEILNKITHPVILKIVLERSSSKSTSDTKIFVINTPLLFESGYNQYMDYNISVEADDELCVRRGKVRDGLSENEIKKRLEVQFSLTKRAKFSDYIINNKNSLQDTKKQVEKIWKILQKHIQNP